MTMLRTSSAVVYRPIRPLPHVAGSYKISVTRPSIQSRSIQSSQPAIFPNLAARNPIHVHSSTRRLQNPPSLISKRAYSLWPFGSASSKPTPPPIEQPAIEKVPEAVSIPPPSPETLLPLETVIDQPLLLSTTSSSTQELAALELEHGFLARYTSGMIEQLLCLLHDQAALPWFLTIPVVIVAIRTVLIPVNVWSMRIGARNVQVKPAIDDKITAIKELQTRGEQHKALLAQNELRSFMKREGFRPLAPIGLPLIQGSLFVSFFWALREMGSHHLPSLASEGALWFTDLTLAGPWYGLPLIASGLTLLSVETASEMGGLKAGQSQKLMWFLRAMIVGTLWLFHDLPSAVFLYWCTNNMFSLIWGTFIRLMPKSVKARLKIPDAKAITAEHDSKSTSNPSFLDGFKATVSPSTDPVTSSNSSATGKTVQPPRPILWKQSKSSHLNDRSTQKRR